MEKKQRRIQHPKNEEKQPKEKKPSATRAQKNFGCKKNK